MNLRQIVSALGAILRQFSYAFLIPAAVSLWRDWGTPLVSLPWVNIALPNTFVVFFLAFWLTQFLAGAMRAFGGKDIRELRHREAYVIVGLAWLVMPILGAIPFLATAVHLDPVHALFEAMSGITTTGATVLAEPLETYPDSVMLWRGALQYVGGIGIIVFSIAVIGRLTHGAHRLMESEAPGGTVTRLQPKIVQTAAAIAKVYVGLSVLVFIAYFLVMLPAPTVHGPGEAAWDALFHTMTTLSTGGFSDRTASAASFESLAVLWVMIVAMTIGGGSFALYWAAMRGNPQQLLRSSEFRFYLAVVAIAAAALSVILVVRGDPTAEAVTHGTFQAVSFITTTGYTSTDHNAFPNIGRLILFVLMFLGGMAGSTSGAIKMFRLQTLLRLTRHEILRILHPRSPATIKAGGRLMSETAVRRTVVFFFAYVTLVVLGSLVYTMLGMDLVSAISASAASVGNIGPALGSVSSSFLAMPSPGLLLSILQMWAGRLEIFTVLLLFLPRTYKE